MITVLQLLKSRTVLFAILLAVLSVVQGYITLLPITPVLRIITTQPISEK
jgi:hypothetical protein